MTIQGQPGRRRPPDRPHVAVFQRMWNVCLAYSEAGFRAGSLDVHQLVLERG